MNFASCIAIATGLITGAAPLGQDSFERDRQAILAMAGHFEVRFRFEETLARQPGYELRERYDEAAREYVVVVEDTGTKIGLQHILIVDHDSTDPLIVKHWRQDWTYQDTDWTVYRGGDTWERLVVAPEEVAGTWTQAVFQTGGAPRYESAGRWEHLESSSAWTSRVTWRPLPRRERAREDYHLLRGVNRHTVGTHGWFHEQDNQKLALDDAGGPAEVVVHELGLNSYERVPADGMELAHDYWDGTQEFWGGVRELWVEAFPEPGIYRVAGKRTVRSVGSLADDYLSGEIAAEYGARVRELIIGSVQVVDEPIEAAARTDASPFGASSN